MNKYLSHIIDDFILDHKKLNGHSIELEVQDLSFTAIKRLINTLYNFDDRFQDVVKDYIHDIINERLPEIEREYNYERGFVPFVDQGNGELLYRSSK